MAEFDANSVKNQLVAWVRKWFEENGDGCSAVIGISGGKDSTVAAALFAEALGPNRVMGVMMPNIAQADIADSIRVCDHLGIRRCTIPVTVAVGGLQQQAEYAGIHLSTQACINLPPRVRMATLYMVAQSIGGRVVNTSNLSEKWIGWGTRFGDTVGDLCPLAGLTASEVVQIGHAFALPKDLVDKIPSDGLTGRSDEDNFGFSYVVLDRYIRLGKIEDLALKDRIDRMHKMTRFKLSMPPEFNPGIPVLAAE